MLTEAWLYDAMLLAQTKGEIPRMKNCLEKVCELKTMNYHEYYIAKILIKKKYRK